MIENNGENGRSKFGHYNGKGFPLRQRKISIEKEIGFNGDRQHDRRRYYNASMKMKVKLKRVCKQLWTHPLGISVGFKLSDQFGGCGVICAVAEA